jgi:hypothetical protein
MHMRSMGGWRICVAWVDDKYAKHRWMMNMTHYCNTYTIFEGVQPAGSGKSGDPISCTLRAHSNVAGNFKNYRRDGYSLDLIYTLKRHFLWERPFILPHGLIPSIVFNVCNLRTKKNIVFQSLCWGFSLSLAWLLPVFSLATVPATRSVRQNASTPLQVK